ncbi:hypothetical protein Q5P01_022266 [Channa striata]|uniref:Uncharacterized protein n=1 Tax=Channa striata TaxID=64152 RepID=A0AA88IZD1_CHASR|nr:hypothetical protein Q5P01_022266 [Channa striata]
MSFEEQRTPRSWRNGEETWEGEEEEQLRDEENGKMDEGVGGCSSEEERRKRERRGEGQVEGGGGEGGYAWGVPMRSSAAAASPQSFPLRGLRIVTRQPGEGGEGSAVDGTAFLPFACPD